MISSEASSLAVMRKLVNEPVNGGRQGAAIFTKLEYLIFKFPRATVAFWPDEYFAPA